ncbi:MAG: hypothetical protein HY899_05085 [Deltaproteobacteria bacterium]|nr:hypothetical protein [Deltaproteobacteria bacterium]
MAHARNDAEEWNVLVVCRQGPGVTGRTLAALGRLGRFRTGGYPQVLLGVVGRTRATSAPSLAAGIEELVAGAAPFDELVERVLPVEKAILFRRDDVTETLCEELEGTGPRLAGRSFHVRSHLRGLKGRVEHPALERALGAFLAERAEAAGAPARVTFDDPDFIVAVEVAGQRVGYAFLDRELRASSRVRAK